MKLLAAFLFLLATTSVAVQAQSGDEKDAKLFKGLDTPAAKAVLTFKQALKSGDKALAKAQLADDIIIFEGGRVERSADEYAHHHMLSDMKYLKMMESKTLEHQVEVFGNTAVSVSRSHTKGTYKDKQYDYESMETIVLEQQDGQWKIKHIHWSN
ncbi:YybH family protein [Pseudoalteromonas sp. T1lg10]|uniref:YybH family protein n=1 Tax=Pseudoalteromonas sp. T1lg10 TaxID=2077093 RepID=UPI000CF6FC89|nr:nuclear transport factor 2 family protein [Pseudoalteromonas sp. T1lg10]